jgi:hypothetical protein
MAGGPFLHPGVILPPRLLHSRLIGVPAQGNLLVRDAFRVDGRRGPLLQETKAYDEELNLQAAGAAGQASIPLGPSPDQPLADEISI